MIGGKVTNRVAFHVPITRNETLQFSGIAGLSLRNAGDTLVQLSDGMWTLEPGATLHINVLEDSAVLDIQGIAVRFDNTNGGTVNKLQIFTIIASNC